jgi:hypothetical protein
VCVLAGTTPASAAEPPLVFAETAALQTTCAKLAGGVGVTIRNETAAKRRVHLVAVELKNSVGAGVRSDAVCGGLTITVAPVLGGGRGTTATVSAKKKREGGFSGSLLLSASKGRVTRRDLSISPQTPVAGLEAKPLVEGETVKLDKSDSGPIWIPVDGPASDLPIAASQNHLTVGAVSGANGAAAVVYGGRHALNHSAARVKLELDPDGLDPGAYKGTVDLNRSDDEKGAVELEVKVTAWWPIAAGLLLVGILAALLLQRLYGCNLPLVRLRRRIRDLRGRHDGSLTKLTSKAGERSWGEFAIGDIASLQEALEEQLNGAAERVALQIDKKLLEGVESAIAGVESQIDLLKEIPAHAEDLEAELGKLNLERPPDPGPLPAADAPQDRPSLDAEARKALRGRPVRAAMLKPVIEEIDARTKQILTLEGLNGRLADLRRARRTLDRLREGKRLRELDGKLNTIRYLLWTARTAEDLDTAAEEIQAAAKLTAELWEALPGSPPTPSPVARHATASEPLLEYTTVESPSESLSQKSAVIEALEVPPGAPASTATAPPPVPPAPPLPPHDASLTEREVSRAFWVQWVVIVIAGLVAVITGLIALYVPNETWGSPWDYVAAAIWGLGAQATVSSLATSVDVLGPLGLRRG